MLPSAVSATVINRGDNFMPPLRKSRAMRSLVHASVPTEFADEPQGAGSGKLPRFLSLKPRAAVRCRDNAMIGGGRHTLLCPAQRPLRNSRTRRVMSAAASGTKEAHHHAGADGGGAWLATLDVRVPVHILNRMVPKPIGAASTPDR